MRFGVVSLFPEMVGTIGEFGVVGRAKKRELISIDIDNPRDYTNDVHRTVDDRPYGGGPGMVMKFEPVAAALEAAKGRMSEGCPVVYLSPQGRVFDQQMAKRFSNLPGLLLLAGRYEGIDERTVESEIDEEWSIGDYVISGGELAAAVIIDAVTRLLPGVLGDEQSAIEDSFVDGLLDHPHYTRPEVAGGKAVPEVLLSGDHEAIRRWRRKQALGRTWQRRPDLLEGRELDKEAKILLQEFRRELEQNC